MQSLARRLQKAFSTNQSSSAFTAKVATLTKPSGNGVVKLADSPGQEIPGAVRVFPYGLGSDNDVFSLRIWGWHQVGSGDNPNTLWIPSALGEFVCTIGTGVGVATSPVLNTERFADTITIVATVGQATVSADVTPSGTVILFSPANQTPAWFQIDTYGAELLEFDTDQTTGTPTANALLLFL